MDKASTFSQTHPELAGYSFEQELYPMQDGTESAETVKSKYTFDGNKVYEQTLDLNTGEWNQKFLVEGILIWEDDWNMDNTLWEPYQSDEYQLLATKVNSVSSEKKS